MANPPLYEHVLACYLLSANSYTKMTQYENVIRNCETILAVEDNSEAFMIKAHAYEML